MAKVEGIDVKRVSKLRHLVDFYNWKGLTVARMWPQKMHHPLSKAQVANWNYFKQAVHEWYSLSDPMRSAYRLLVKGAHWTAWHWWKSMRIRALNRVALGGFYARDFDATWDGDHWKVCIDTDYTGKIYFHYSFLAAYQPDKFRHWEDRQWKVRGVWIKQRRRLLVHAQHVGPGIRSGPRGFICHDLRKPDREGWTLVIATADDYIDQICSGLTGLICLPSHLC